MIIKINPTLFAADIADRVVAMAQDSKANNAALIERLLTEHAVNDEHICLEHNSTACPQCIEDLRRLEKRVEELELLCLRYNSVVSRILSDGLWNEKNFDRLIEVQQLGEKSISLLLDARRNGVAFVITGPE